MLSENIYTATIGANGRVVIPAELRREFGWDEGKTITFSRDDHGHVLISDTMRTWQDVRDSLANLPNNAAAEQSMDAFLQQRRADWAE